MLSELLASPKLVGLDMFVRPVVSGIPVVTLAFGILKLAYHPSSASFIRKRDKF